MMLQKIVALFLFFYSFAVAAHDTVLKLYRPYGDVVYQVAPQIKKTLTGDCYAQSRLIVREDAWQCMAEGRRYDPCFVKAGPNRTSAVCPTSPWVGDSVEIRVKTPLNNEQNKTLDMSRTYPWALELANGEYCQAIHAGKTYEALPVRYKCSKNNYLIGYLQRCKAVWSMLEKTSAEVVTVQINKAWF